ncbi:MAG: hypothetical protein QNJ98_17160 [Planctomycetota bacterium]|nr:hypothetical protein [Planctomycetota bacterium]
MRSWILGGALALLLLTPACGESEPEAPRGPPAAKPGAGRPVVPVEPIALEARARFALDRVLRGPEPTCAVLRIPRLHATSLGMAERDLVDMAPQTLAILDDDALIARLTAADTPDTNRWLGVLSVLMAIPQKPADLVVRWTEPALARPRDIPLLRRGIRTITTVRDVAVAPTILKYLQTAPGDRIIAPKAIDSLSTFGSPWRERAVAVALTHGGPYFWGKLPEVLSLQQQRTVVDPTQSTTLAWTVHWMEGSGPRTPTSLPREQKHAWSRLRLWTDPQARRTTRQGADGVGYRVLAYGLLPLEMAYGAGWFTCDTAKTGLVPSSTLYFTGRTPAAEGRCTLASRSHLPFIASRDAEDTEAYKAIDRAVYYAAHHCVDADTEGPRREENFAELEALLERAIQGGTPGVDGVPLPPDLSRLIGGLPDPREPRVRALLVRILRELRPVASWRTVIYVAHDSLVPAAPPTEQDLALMTSLAIEGTEEDRGVALDLIQRSRFADYIPLVERMLAEGLMSDPAVLWRTLMYMYSTTPGIEPRALLAFADRAATWIRESVEPERGPARAAAVAVGLLDYGERGAEAYARFMRGPGRPAYVQALMGRTKLLPPSVVRALLEPVGAETSDVELRTILAVAWRLFPASAAGDLAALRTAVPEARRALVDAALVRVKHRGPRAAR